MAHGEHPVAVRVDAAAVEAVRDGETTGASADTTWPVARSSADGSFA